MQDCDFNEELPQLLIGREANAKAKANVPSLIMCDTRMQQYGNNGMNQQYGFPPQQQQFGPPPQQYGPPPPQNTYYQGNVDFCGSQNGGDPDLQTQITQLHCVIQERDIIIAQLQQQFCMCQCQLDEIVEENCKLKSKMLQLCSGRKKKSASSCRTLCLESQLDASMKSTAMLEEQVCQMEKTVSEMRDKLAAVRAAKARDDCNNNVVMIYPNGCPVPCNLPCPLPCPMPCALPCPPPPCPTPEPEEQSCGRRKPSCCS